MALRSYQATGTAGLLFAALALIAPYAAQADSGAAPVPCGAPLHYPLPSGKPALRELAAVLEPLSLQRGCLRDAQFQAYRGAVLLALGEHEAAVEPLERALLLQPDFPGAELDLAIAFARLGQTQTARALLAQVQQRSDLPAPLRAALLQQQSALAEPPPTSMRNRWQVSLMGGHETNLNNAPAITQLTLTLPNGLGRQTLPLAPSSLPRSGNALFGAAQWQGVRPAGESLWVFQAEGRWRQTRQASTGFRQVDAAATWLQQPLAEQQWIGRVAGTWLEFGGHPLVRSARASLQYQWPALRGGTCRPALGAELDARHFPSSAELDGLYRGGVVSWTCTSRREGAGDPAVLTFQLRAGEDRPDSSDRPGGVQKRTELRAQWETPLATPWRGVLGPGRASVQASYVRQADASGYSPLIEENAARQTRRAALQVEASYALGGGLFAVGTAELASQRSNLPVFIGRQRSLYLGLRWEMM